jgi:cysteinyl-tRNA synthetase
MHNGILQFGGEKMSKSLGNVVSLRDALDEWGRETLLMLFMGAHWRKPMDYTDETLQQAKAQWTSFLNAFTSQAPAQPASSWEDFAAALNDDFNTPAALAILHEWRFAAQRELLGRGLNIFGFVYEAEAPTPGLEEKARARLRARESREFEEADRLRAEIEAMGWDVRDIDQEPGYQLVPKR